MFSNILIIILLYPLLFIDFCTYFLLMSLYLFPHTLFTVLSSLKSTYQHYTTLFTVNYSCDDIHILNKRKYGANYKNDGNQRYCRNWWQRKCKYYSKQNKMYHKKKHRNKKNNKTYDCGCVRFLQHIFAFNFGAVETVVQLFVERNIISINCKGIITKIMWIMFNLYALVLFPVIPIILLITSVVLPHVWFLFVNGKNSMSIVSIILSILFQMYVFMSFPLVLISLSMV
eukprot:19539_1